MNNNILITIVLIFTTGVINASQNNQTLQGVPLIINEFHADPASGITGDANGDGVRHSSDDEFVEIYNNSANPIDITGWTLSDATSTRHIFPSGSIVEGNCSIVVFGGNPVGAFGFSKVQTSSTDNVGLNNSGDTISLMSGASVVSTYTYGAEGGNNQSLTRDPVATGLFVEHSSATGSNGSLFSPGMNNDGTFFSGCTVGDLPPNVSSTSPVNLASGVAADTNITFNFNEDVTIMPNAFEIDCGGNSIAWDIEGGATTTSITINPSTDLPSGFCTVTALASLITDLDDDIDELDGNGDTAGGDNFTLRFIVGVPDLEIWEIQGNSTATIYDGFSISSNGNIVTALDTNGFFMQTPEARDDNDVNTSNGIFVYIDEDPSATISVGDEVNVDGPMVEFFGMTEFSFANVVVVSSLNELPPPVLLDDNFPPHDPTIAPCSTDLETHKYECFEGMHFDMPQGFISAGTAATNPFFPGSDGEDVLVSAGTSRAFREPGIDFPGDVGLPNSPIFDGNPEILEMDIDSLTLPLTNYAGGSEVSIKGVFGYEFGEYEIWPSEITVINENVVPGAVRDSSAMEVTIASANLFRFFDDVDDPSTNSDDDTILTPQDYQLRLTKLSKYFREDLKSPMIIGLQEIENLKVLDDLAAKIVDDGGPGYSTSLIVGNDIGGIDVGFMYQTALVTLNTPVAQLGDNETQTLNGFTLHDRPPLHLDADVNLNGTTVTVNVLVVHMRSRGGIDGSESTRVRQKRFEQANSVANMINVIKTNHPGKAIITIGDFNAFEFTDGYADMIGQITGTAVEIENEYWQAPIFASAPLTQAIQTLTSDEQYSFVFRGSAQLLDHALLNDEALLMMNEMQFARGQSDVNFSHVEDNTTSLRVSDHDGFVLFLSNDAIFMNGFE